MKKLINIGVAVFAAFTFASCSGDTPKSTQTPSTQAVTTPKSWVGHWKGLDGGGNQIFLIDISADSVKIDWATTKDTTAVYWRGSFEEMKTDTVVSNADTEAMGMSVLSSRDSTKVFTFTEGKLTFKSSAMGVTKIIHFAK